MTDFDYRHPIAWREPSALRLDPEVADFLEHWIEQLVRGVEVPHHNERAQHEAMCRRIHHQLECGSGAMRHDSACLEQLDAASFRRVFDQICSGLGMPVPIDLEGRTTKEVRDAGKKDSKLAPARGHMTNQELAFHSDRADLTVLACWQPAAEGGQFRITSSSALLRDLERDAPAWWPWLSRAIPHDLRDESSTTDRGWCELPLFSGAGNDFALRYIRKFNESTIRHGVTLPPEVCEMLDDIDARLEAPGASVEVAFRRGVFVIVNNHTTLHARRAFRDSDGAPTRCLLRSWLSSPFTRALPLAWTPVFHDVRPGAWRGGVLGSEMEATT